MPKKLNFRPVTVRTRTRSRNHGGSQKGSRLVWGATQTFTEISVSRDTWTGLLCNIYRMFILSRLPTVLKLSLFTRAELFSFDIAYSITFRDYFQMEGGRLNHREYLLNLGTSNCPGCLDLDPMTFDWMAVHLASAYPSLNPLDISQGADRGCSSCRIIMAGFLGFGRDLSTLDASYSIGLFNRRKRDSLQAMISHKGQSITDLEFYTVEGW